MLTGKELELLNCVLTVMSPLEEAIKIISGDTYCIASMMIKIVNILKKKKKKLHKLNDSKNLALRLVVMLGKDCDYYALIFTHAVPSKNE